MTISQNYQQTWQALGKLWKKFAVILLLLFFAQLLTRLFFFPAVDTGTRSISTLIHTQSAIATIVSESPIDTLVSLTVLITIIDLFILLPFALFIVIIKNRNSHDSLFDDLGHFGKLLIPLVTTWFIAIVIAMLGFVALVIPGIILSIFFFFFPYYVIYHKKSSWDAVKASKDFVQKHFGKLFVHILAIKIPALIPLWLVWTIAFAAVPNYAPLIIKLYSVLAFLVGLTYLTVLFEKLDKKK